MAYIREAEIDDSEENGDDFDCENLDEHEEVPEKENEKEEDNEEVPEKDNEACPENDKKEEEEEEVYTREALSPFKAVRVCLFDAGHDIDASNEIDAGHDIDASKNSVKRARSDIDAGRK